MNNELDRGEAFNETLRVLSHDYSGHMHLIRFCIDELMQDQDQENPFVKKLNQGLERFENDLNLLKQSTPYFLDEEVPLSKIAARAFGQARIYLKKHYADLTWNIENDSTVKGCEANDLCEILFSFAHLFSTLAKKEGRETFHITLEIKDELRKLIFIKSELNKYLRQELDSILNLGDENEKSLRRYIGIHNFLAKGKDYEILDGDNNLSVRFEL
ncbi:hypothetical protein ABMA79_02185 [Halobacteriovorax sp. HFRX-2_2]|uniref:hypothetical protein n=1 Tax=Halobacteriovorax sp. HFRX-2_2 TaxID=3157717 RepID=UPI00371AEC7E